VRPDDFGCSWNDWEDARLAGGAFAVCRAGAGWGLRWFGVSGPWRRAGAGAGRTGRGADFGAADTGRACRGGVDRVGIGAERGEEGGAGNGGDGGAALGAVFGAARDGVDGERGGVIVPATEPTGGSGSPRRTAATAIANSPPVP
jgi:hypothetical protein